MTYYQDDDAFLEQFFDNEDADLVSYYDRYEEAIGRFDCCINRLQRNDYIKLSGYSSPTPNSKYTDYTSNLLADSRTQDYPHYTSAQDNHNAFPEFRETQRMEGLPSYQLPPIRSSGPRRRKYAAGKADFVMT